MEALVWFRNDLRLEDNPALEMHLKIQKKYVQYLFFN